MALGTKLEAHESKLSGLINYFSVLFTPRAAFERLSRVPMWGWAALAGTILTLLAVIISAPAQTHLAGLLQQQRIAGMPTEQRAQAAAALAQAAPLTKIFLILGAIVGPWIAWLIGAIVFLIAAALIGGEAKFAGAWVVALNSYVVYAVAGVVNSIILSFRDPSSVNSATDVVALPSLGLLFNQSPKLVTFLSAYNVLYVWYYVVVVIALEQVLKIPRRAAVIATIIYSLLFALFATASV